MFIDYFLQLSSKFTPMEEGFDFGDPSDEGTEMKTEFAENGIKSF